MVRLEEITEKNYRECLKLKVAEGQQKFVSPNVLSLAKAYIHYEEVTPFAIYNDDIMVGFIMVRFWKEDNYYFIWQFMIDERYQNKGYGKKALNLIIEWVKTEKDCKRLVTTYIEGNEQVRLLYTKVGFESMSELLDGEVDMVLHL